jgi:O-glycosyl hydrolase
MDLNEIRPRDKDSGKYSSQLYNFLKKHYPKGANVYFISTQYDRYDETTKETIYKDVEFSRENLHPIDIWIGKQYEYDPDWYHGNSLNTILGSSQSKYVNFANPC